jgi:serine/threonine protein kinase
MLCPSCGGELSPAHRFCPFCAAPVSSLSQAPTAAVESPAAPAAAPVAVPVGRLISSDSLPVGGFTPGMVLAERYRIIGLIGRGGMGEVYRTDDLKLGQPVALKFLPRSLADDPVRRERLFAEVRIARQVSHPNICRVYDISEMEGRHFLTMEYIDGEDLASLLKRIGNLHGTKALDVAKQLCAGLAAAHDKGVLHRDLKPANVMIDGRGRVRITDFGLAVAAGEEIPEADVSGTPPYMAPEQFAGKGASVRSDIYALGLVFYEIFTGKRAFEAKTLAELRAKKETSAPAAPSEIARDIDPIVERVILRCIDKDPRQRPASAVQVAAALPGGDPLAAALAAGETPSPEMVAASGSTEGLKPWIAWACLTFIILGISAVIMLSPKVNLFQRVPVEKPPDAMAEKARDILKSLGYSDSPVDSVFRFEANQEYLQNVAKKHRSPTRFEKLPALAIQFWYRQSPEPLVHSPLSKVTPSDPPLAISGESVVWLDSQGHLTGLRVIPSEEGKPSGATQPSDWSVLIKAAGLDPAKCTSVEPDRKYFAYADTRAAWKGALPDHPDVPIRIEAAAWQGKPVYLRLVAPFWEGPSTSIAASLTPQTEAPQIAKRINSLVLLIAIVGGGAFFARRNLRMGRGDRRGATRLACFVLCLNCLAWVFSEHHVGGDSGRKLFMGSASDWFLTAGTVWLMYIALEPFVRRRWPGMLVGWSRLLAGDYRDPLVGRDLLVGCAAGIVWALFNYSGFFVSLFGVPQPIPSTGNPQNGPVATLALFSGARAIVGGIFVMIFVSMVNTLVLGFLLFLMRVLLRSTWAAAAVIVLLTVVSFFTTGESLISFIPIALGTAVILFIIFRFGLLACLATIVFYRLLLCFPITTQSIWYSGIGWTGLAILLALTLYAFHASLGGQPLFGLASLED